MFKKGKSKFYQALVFSFLISTSLFSQDRYELGSYRSVYVKQDYSDIIESVRRQRNAEYNNAIQKINAYEKVVKKMWTEHKMSDFEEVKIPDGWHNLIYYNGLEYDGIVSEYKGFVSNGYLTNIFTRNRMESLIYGHPKAQIFSPWESIYDFEWAPSFPLKISKKGFAENEWSFAPYLTNPNQKVAPPELGGNLSLWTNKKRGPWEIYINEFRWFGAGFTSYFNGKPQCGQSGTLNQDLVPGIYRITVKKGFKVQTINVTIRENGCTLINPMDK